MADQQPPAPAGPHQQQLGGGVTGSGSGTNSAQQSVSPGVPTTQGGTTPSAPATSTATGSGAPDTSASSLTPTSQPSTQPPSQAQQPQAQAQQQDQSKQRQFMQAGNLVKQARHLPGSVAGARVPPKDIHNMTDAVGTAAISTASSHMGAASTGASRPTADGTPSSSSLNTMRQMDQARSHGPVASMQEETQVLPERKVRDLLRQLDASQEIDHDALELVMDVANEFVEQVVSFSCKLAKHRNSTTLEARDVLLHLERNWDIRLPGISVEDTQIKRQAAASSNKHKERVKAVLSDMKDAAGPAKKRSKTKKKA